MNQQVSDLSGRHVAGVSDRRSARRRLRAVDGARLLGDWDVWVGVYARSCAGKALLPSKPRHRFLCPCGAEASRSLYELRDGFGTVLGNVDSRALRLQRKDRGDWNGWCPVAGALGPERLCSQPPLHMQLGSPAARGGSSAESGKPARGGALSEGKGWDPPCSCGVGIPDGHCTHSQGSPLSVFSLLSQGSEAWQLIPTLRVFARFWLRWSVSAGTRGHRPLLCQVSTLLGSSSSAVLECQRQSEHRWDILLSAPFLSPAPLPPLLEVALETFSSLPSKKMESAGLLWEDVSRLIRGRTAAS